jgi:hypothetical protein
VSKVEEQLHAWVRERKVEYHSLVRKCTCAFWYTAAPSAHMTSFCGNNSVWAESEMMSIGHWSPEPFALKFTPCSLDEKQKGAGFEAASEMCTWFSVHWLLTDHWLTACACCHVDAVKGTELEAVEATRYLLAAYRYQFLYNSDI